MKFVNLKKQKSNFVIGEEPIKSHYGQVIGGDVILKDNNEIVCIYTKIPSNYLRALRVVVNTTKYSETYRTSALPTKSSVFGSQPRNALRNDYCRLTAWTTNEVANFKKLLNFSKYVCEIYKKYLPKDYNNELAWVNNNVDSDYLFNESPYTSINVNVNHAIKYHKDTGNVKGSYSNIIIVKNNINGGELVLPEYGVALEQADGYMAIIKGQSVVHGVMPIKQKSGENYYRASIVYYTPNLMGKCLPFNGEVKRYQEVRVKRARSRAYG